MSGFEVVGVVLALFPVVVDGVRTWKQVNSGQPLEHLIRDIITEQMIFRCWLGRLLMPAVRVEALKEMLDPKSDKYGRWKDPCLRTAIEQAFGFATTDFLLSTFDDIHKELRAIQEALSYIAKTNGVSDPGPRLLTCR